jgi:hypothetical protein
MDPWDDNDKKRIEEYKKNPMANLSDSINRSMFGAWGWVAKGGGLSGLIGAGILIGILLLIAYFN